ncbi:importin-alpha export receptor [Tieghemiomyces parasiticus]|uniref:Importin-alpha export receptor n=1 Tax=Tieghemiomyces parasiticus TaxID=78921 RepID=A0A9W8E319_9FUNG|nr:importin-alpha export receptor [Tieghemiomyces parasiticus]
MAVQAPTLDALAQYLQQTLQPGTRKQAEQFLQAAEKTPHFIISLLTLAGSDTTDPAVRFAASLYFKNYVKKHWEIHEDQANVIAEEDRKAVKDKIVDLMISLPTNLQLQISDGLAIIAKHDFPDKWPTLIATLNSKLSPQNYHVNNGVLQTAHAIFKRWRKEFRSNDLFLEIRFVLEQFTGPFTEIFKTTDQLIETHKDNKEALQTLLPAMLLLVKIFYSLNCQDLPEYFEDHMAEFMGILHKYLVYQNPLVDNGDDDEATDVEKIKAGVCEIIALYTNRLEESFAPLLPKFVETVWSMLTTLGPQPKFDLLACKALGFLTTVVHQPGNRELFASEDTMKLVCEKIVLPNMALRESDEELFEDEPLQYVVHDVEAAEADTRRRAAGDLVRALLHAFPAETTRIVSTYVDHYLARYAQDPAGEWRAKDVALFMVTSISAVSVVARHGATKVNDLVNVTDFFSQHILGHLQKVDDGSHPILKVDAIKYVYTFRSQLTKDQLAALLPLLCQHLSHPHLAVAAYATLCLERIFFIKRDRRPLFSPDDVRPYVEPLFGVLFESLERAGSAERMAEREFTMKLIMRVIITYRQRVATLGPAVLAKLGAILDLVSRNPSNPQFNHYLFESLAVLARFTVAADPGAVGAFEQTLFPTFQYILQNDVADFTPYAFQILAQLLAAHAGRGLPDAYKALFPPLLQPVLWENSGNVPALVRLVKAYLQVGPDFVVPAHLSPVLGIFQKLLAHKATDHQAFDLLSTLWYYSPVAALQPQFKAVLTLILNRLQTRSHPKLVRAFVYFAAFLCALDKGGNGLSMPTLLVRELDAIQPQLFAGILQSLIIPNVKLLSTPLESKVAVVGYLRLLTTEPAMLQPPYAAVVPDLLVTLAEKLPVQVVDGAVGKTDGEAANATAADEDDLDAIDLVDSTAFQTNYTRLATMAKTVLDPVPAVTDYRAYLKENLGQLNTAQPALLKTVAERLSPEAKAAFGM